MPDQIQLFCQSSVKLSLGPVVYFDPFKIPENFHDADLIFLTHEHFDHYSPEDLEKVRQKNTLVIAPASMNVANFEKILTVEPNQTYRLTQTLKFSTIPAYNLDKPFHPKTNHWVGYLLKLAGITYYIAGDTDATPEAKNVHCDIAFVPVGGTYTMNAKEAAELVNIIRPQIAVPTHYGSIVGTAADAETFVASLSPATEGKIYLSTTSPSTASPSS